MKTQLEECQRRTQNPVEHLRWNFLVKMVNAFQPLTIFAEKLHLTCSSGLTSIFQLFKKIVDGQHYHKWDKVIKSGPSKICGRQPLKTLSRPYPFKFFKGYLAQISLDPLLNTLSQMSDSVLNNRLPPKTHETKNATVAADDL